MLVLEVALGVVLGVLLLRFWPQVLAIGLLGTVALLCFALVGLLIVFLVAPNPELRQFQLVAVGCLLALATFLVARSLARRFVVPTADAVGIVILLLFLAGLTVLAAQSLSAVLTFNESAYFLIVPLLAIAAWFWVIYRLRVYLSERPLAEPGDGKP